MIEIVTLSITKHDKKPPMDCPQHPARFATRLCREQSVSIVWKPLLKWILGCIPSRPFLCSGSSLIGFPPPFTRWIDEEPATRKGALY